MASSATVSRGDRGVEAAFWTLAGAFFFSLMNAAAKYLGVIEQFSASSETIEAIPVLEITFARYAVAACLILPFMCVRPSRFRFSSPKRYLIRTSAGFGGIALMFAAVQTVPLASATAIGFTSPIFAMVFSMLLLSERIPYFRWLAAALGLIGALIIASPGSGVPLFGALIALSAAAFMGAEVVGVKWLAQTRDGAITILFYSNLMGLVMSGAFMASDFVKPAYEQLLVMCLVGLMAILGQACFIRAAKIADANFLAPFFYVSLFYAALIGYLFFDELPSLQVVIGCLAILSSAAIMLRVR